MSSHSPTQPESRCTLTAFALCAVRAVRGLGVQVLRVGLELCTRVWGLGSGI